MEEKSLLAERSLPTKIPGNLHAGWDAAAKGGGRSPDLKTKPETQHWVKDEVEGRLHPSSTRQRLHRAPGKQATESITSRKHLYQDTLCPLGFAYFVFIVISYKTER